MLNRVQLAVGTVAAVLAVGGALFLASRHEPASTVVRVGVDHSPPFYSIRPDGSVTGLAVDVFSEAARRRKLKLVWVPLHDMPLDAALRQRTAQIWPLVSASDSRRKEFWLSDPWLESDFVIVSRAQHPIRNPDDAAGQTLAHARLTTTTSVARRFFPNSRELVRLYRADAIQSVCREEAGAALIESRMLDAILLTRPAGCEAVNFHISSLRGVSAPLCIMAVPEAQGAAKQLRDEIARMADDGFLSAKLDEWEPFSAQGTRSLWAQQAAERRSRIYSYFAVAIGALAVVLIVLIHRARRLQTKLRDSQRRFAAFMDNSPAIAFMKDAAGRVIYVNRAWSRMSGREPEECYGKTEFELWPEPVARRMRAADEQLLKSPEALRYVEQVPSGNGTRAVLTIKFPFASETGEQFVGGTGIDVTEREVALARYRELFEHNPLPAWVCDRQTLAFLMVNDAACRKYGWLRDDFLNGLHLTDVLAGEDASAAPATLDGAHAHRRRWTHHTKDGRVLTVDVTSYELDYEGREARLMIVSDVSEQERVLEQLRLSEERWQLALRGAGDALWDWDLRQGRIFRSPSWRSMLGYEQHEIGDRPEDLFKLLHPDDSAALEEAVEAHLEGRTDSFTAEYRLRHKDGTWRWIHDRGQAVFDDRGKPVRMAGSQTDVTDRKTLETLLEIEARTDALTGLMNRREFDRRVAELFRSARSSHLPLTACLCDLDCFKDVNDTHGHAAGDHVLMAFGNILRQNLRRTDLVARIGGDEFLLALPGSKGADARTIVERVREQLNALSFQVGGRMFNVSSSFGVAELRADHSTPADLLADADRMLYEAKKSGRNKTMAA